uniref:HEPN domain-containing protein n=1 Tax=Ignisphaera aggregans TaxID=334771 RepID=A0A7J3QEB9_9CREN
MNSIAMAKAYIRQATEGPRHAKEAFKEGNYPYVVRQSQEAVELLLKASLRLVDVELLKWHDVGLVLRKEMDKFSQWFRELMPKLARISRKLRREREHAMYSDEGLGASSDELYSVEDAEEALNWAIEILQVVSKLFRELVGLEKE